MAIAETSGPLPTTTNVSTCREAVQLVTYYRLLAADQRPARGPFRTYQWLLVVNYWLLATYQGLFLLGLVVAISGQLGACQRLFGGH